jgi:predicted nucleotide-binding protein (sugar kinase/HSP70/actin superfamily)
MLMTHTPISLRVIPDEPLDVEAELRAFEAEERLRLGLEPQQLWRETMAGLTFTRAEKAHVTLLLGGLTLAHDFLVEGALASLGYRTVALECPDKDALRVGKEFGNRGQCNPTYFTVGNLVKYLIHLRDEQGLSSQAIIANYVFLTAGACGPCRFGMYATEYRKALRDAGFDGFRVVLFQQQGGLRQATGDDSGLELTPRFFVAILKALLAGDILNGIGYRLRPYELEAGAVDRALTEAKRLCHDALHERKSILRALMRSRRIFQKVKVDRTVLKPKVAVIGEFWAMTTEGDGNYHLQRFLEQEGAEVDIQLITAWLLYNIWEVRFDTAARTNLRQADAGHHGLSSLGKYGLLQRRVGLWAAEKALRGAFALFARVAGFGGYRLADMDEVAKIAAPYYNNDLRGGEGHMEVGKVILNVVKSKATMTLSVKPFGCMPSSGVSDGVQSLVAERYPGTIFCAVETTGDGAVNFQSRIQMFLFKAKQAAAREHEQALAETGLSADAVRAFVARHRRLGDALHHPAHKASTTAADFVYAASDAWRGGRFTVAAPQRSA